MDFLLGQGGLEDRPTFVGPWLPMAWEGEAPSEPERTVRDDRRLRGVPAGPVALPIPSSRFPSATQDSIVRPRGFSGRRLVFGGAARRASCYCIVTSLSPFVTRTTSSTLVMPWIVFFQPSIRNVVIPARTAAFLRSQLLALS